LLLQGLAEMFGADLNQLLQKTLIKMDEFLKLLRIQQNLEEEGRFSTTLDLHIPLINIEKVNQYEESCFY
jgi:hypothetical protein